MAVSVFSLNPAGVPVVQTVLSILSIALVLSVFRALWAAVYNLVAHPLHTVPGPKLWAVSDLPYALCNCSGNSHRRILALHKKYGPVVRVGPNDVVLNHPDAWKELMGHRKSAQGEHAKEPYIMFEAQHSVIGANREDHARIRRAISHGFSAQAMLDQQPIIRKYVDLLIQRLRDHATRRSDEAVEMTTWFNWATFDIIGDLSFGEPFGCLEKTEWHPWVHIIFESFVNLVYLASLKRFPKLFAALMWAAGPTISDTRSKHRKFGHDRITERLALTTERHDFIESLVQRQGEKGLSREEIDETAATLVTAGGETTATALSGAIYYLTTHPEVMQKLDQELHANFESEDDMDLISVQKLTYMLAVLNETLRKFSPLGTGIGRQISEGGDVILGHFFPEKTVVTIHHWSMYHNDAYFADPYSFHPERWLDDARFASDVKEAFQPFSYGARNCIGRNLAYGEMRLILARIVWNFDLRLDAAHKNWVEDNKCYFLWQKGPLNVYLTPKRVSGSAGKPGPTVNA